YNTFLAAIRANPRDDALRLVVADWFHETLQDERAEFIRLQLELAGLPQNDAARRGLRQREAELLADDPEAWAGPLAVLGVKCFLFRRGFVEHVTLSGESFSTHAEELFQLAPVRSVQLTGGVTSLVAFLACRHSSSVEKLDLSNHQIGHEGAVALAASP